MDMEKFFDLMRSHLELQDRRHLEQLVLQDRRHQEQMRAVTALVEVFSWKYRDHRNQLPCYTQLQRL